MVIVIYVLITITIIDPSHILQMTYKLLFYKMYRILRFIGIECTNLFSCAIIMIVHNHNYNFFAKVKNEHGRLCNSFVRKYIREESETKVVSLST